jgi:indolepyruvate ferredoxin oxidoreductase alpha subunit
VVAATPGCGVFAEQPPFEAIDVKIVMGSSVSIGVGLAKAGLERRVIAVVGDSDFFHSSMGAIATAVHERAPLTVIVLDNTVTAMSGFQPHPGSDTDASGAKAPRVSIAGVARALGVKAVFEVDPERRRETRRAMERALATDGVSLVLASKPCYVHERGIPPRWADPAAEARRKPLGD